jgi:phenylpropionate dioxygenase-like ring-hydroxylating dioxygenase large terminal subunit
VHAPASKTPPPEQTLPARWYWDDSIFERELEQIFTPSWHLVGATAELSSPGDHLVARAGIVPILVTRDLRGELHAFLNICRHRGHPVALSSGNRKTLQCSYHAWTYDLDGRLKTAPRAEREPCFPTSSLGLVPIALDVWRELVFVNAHPDGRSLIETHPALNTIADELRLDLSGYRYFTKSSAVVQANWKAWFENVSECYHCSTLHAQTFADAWEVAPDAYRFICEDALIAQVAARNAHGRRLPEGTERLRQLHIWPGSFISVDDTLAFAGAVTPLTPQSCEMTSYVYVRRGVKSESIASWLEMYDAALREDVEAVERQQMSLRSNRIPYGHLMPASELAVAHFQRMVRSALKEPFAAD